tara:strand:+ start:1494 stop:2072 length:579 start_codon:yes stop_codon:yes gene_type:complete
MSKPIFKDYHKGEPAAPRIIKYKLHKYLNPDSSVLDVGCNQGEFCLQLSPHIRRAVGIDIVNEHLEQARSTQAKLDVTNCEFTNAGFAEYAENTDSSFDAILCFAAHSYIIGTNSQCRWDEGNISFERFAELLDKLLKPDGYLIIESHPTFDKNHQDWHPLLDVIATYKYKEVEEREGRPSRILKIWKKDAV